jgi:hypothetical protein
MMPQPRHIISGLVLAAVVAAVSLSDRPSMTVTAQTGSSSYLENFDRYETSAPMPLVSYVPPAGGQRSNTLEILTHSRNGDTWQALNHMLMDHGSACQAPPAQHDPGDPLLYPQSSFICAANPHLMTALNGEGYAAMFLTPNHQVDFSAGEAVITFDLSTFRTADRDWIDVWVTPFAQAVTIPFEGGDVDAQGYPMNSVNIKMHGRRGETGFDVSDIRNGIASFFPPGAGPHWYLGMESIPGFIPSASRRDTFEIRISKTHIKVWMPQYGMTWVDRDWVAPLEFSRGVVQLGHHSYTPTKDCVPADCTPQTWHWDNIAISPSIPFTQIHANERASFEASTGQVMAFTFPAPAPPNAFLRIDAIGQGYEVSTDGGATWATLTRQASSRDDPGHVRPYHHPIPAGTTSAQFRTTESGWWGLGMIDDVSIWAEQSPSVPTPPVATPTSLPPTATPEPPTSTPAQTGTPLPTFTPAPSPPTATSIAAATNTAVVATATSVAATSTAIVATATAHAATATAIATQAGTPAPMGSCTVTVAKNGKSGSWSCP